MESIRTRIADGVAAAIRSLDLDGPPRVEPSADERFGDFQSNAAMALAKAAGKKPREVAAAILAALDLDDVVEPPDIAGPGFINFRVKPDHLATVLGNVPLPTDPDGDRLGMPRAATPEIAVVDLSSPNLAKEMHVGHLRSTVIGDAVARVLEFLGHTVIRENHVGDWGTQFGMLVAHLRRTKPDVLNDPDALVIADLETFYVQAKMRFDADEAFKKTAQETVVALQQGDSATRRIWEAFCAESLRHCHRIYDRLDVSLLDRGESFYDALMSEVVRRLDAAGLLVESEGAKVVFLDGFETREGEPLPLIVQKRDGGYNYATSDLATILHRSEDLGATRFVYVVGLPQKLHFEMVFACARKAGFVGEDVVMEHIGFGSMLAASGRPFKTREGGTVKLKDLLDDAVTKARGVLEGDDTSARRAFSDEEMDHIAERVGIAAVKYFDLSHNLSKDYKFDLDTMLSLDGNTAPYMLYAYARIRSIGRKADVDLDALPRVPIRLEHESEIALAKAITRFPDVIEQLGRDLKPNVLTEYLYELSRTFSRFYDRKLGVRVVDADSREARDSRLRLCELTARTLRIGLGLLGIRTVEEM